MEASYDMKKTNTFLPYHKVPSLRNLYGSLTDSFTGSTLRTFTLLVLKGLPLNFTEL